MAQRTSLTKPWHLVMPQALFGELQTHLFPGDRDEHGAVIEAGIAETEHGVRLLARQLHLAVDGRDYVPGRRGYRMLKADFISERIGECREEKLVYLAIHNHGGGNRVSFSAADLRSHERGYPALLDIAGGRPVGALVFARDAIAGDIWLPGERRVALAGASVVGPSLKRLWPAPPMQTGSSGLMYDRQSRLFGDVGQCILAGAKVGVIGLGGAGSLIAEKCGRLGVGRFVLADPEHAELSNIPRLVAARLSDAGMFWPGGPRWLTRALMKLARPKVRMARRNILRANPSAQVEAIHGDFLEAEIARKFLDCDYLFLAADSMRARLLFNAIVHQYLIPGVQVGAKVRTDAENGDVLDVYSVVRPVTPDAGCLFCNGIISSSKLQDECISEQERKQQRYIDDPEIIAPSVITLNALATAQATNDFLFYMTGLQDANASSAYTRFQPRGRKIWFDNVRKSDTCLECGCDSRSRFGKGDGRRLPTMMPN